MPIVYIVGQKDILVEELSKELIAKKCKVILIQNETEIKKYFSGEDIPQYIFLIDGFKNNFISKINLKTIFQFIELYTPKTQIILPYLVNEQTRIRVEHVSKLANKIKNRNLQIVYLGQIYGIGMNIFGEGWVNNVFREIWEKANISIPAYDTFVYVIDVKQAAEILMKGIFSYGFTKKESVLTNKLSVFKYLQKLQKDLPHYTFVTNRNIKQEGTVSNFDYIKTHFKDERLKETIEWILAHRKEVHIEIKITKPKRIVKARKFILIFAIVFWILFLPFFSLFTSSITLKMGLTNLNNLNYKKANFYFDLSNNFANFSKSTFRFFDKGERISLILSDYADTAKGISNSLESGMKIKNEVLGSEDYDLAQQSNQLFLEMDKLSKQTSFLLAETNDFPESKFFIPNSLNLKEIINYLSNTKNIVKNLPNLLGNEKAKNYLILLQDDNELRATGGKIYSYGVFTFENGRLINKNFADVTSADNAFKGQVDPPSALKKYLGINTWKMADSNWDPDFSETASKAEWFLENETGQNADGVVAVNKSFFDKFSNINQLIPGLNSKDVQVFLNDNSFSNELSNLNWDGRLNTPYLAVIESNLGLNKIGKDIVRSQNLSVDLTSEIVKNRLELNLNNLSQSESYRTYIRIINPLDSVYGDVTESVNGEPAQILTIDQDTINGKSEAGILIQIPKEQFSKIIVNWSNKNTKETLFSIRKQSGISDIPTNIRFILPDALTKANSTSYNTNLRSDFNIEIK